MKHLITFRIAFWCATVLLAGCTAGTTSTKEAPKEAPASPSSSEVIILDETNFDAEIGTGVVLVDFWATWCPPCREQGPIVEQVAGQIQGTARVAKVDVDAAPKIAKRFKIRSIPTLIVFKDGKSVEQFVGVTQAEKLVSAIKAAER